ncbi:unnamed protein product [Discosporangium mesarthrocarpum]
MRSHLTIAACCYGSFAAGFRVPTVPARITQPEHARGEGVHVPPVKQVISSVALGLALMGPMVFHPLLAEAVPKRSVGSIPGSGLVFKDTLNVEAFGDPKVEGVSIYLSDFTRPVTDRIINGDIFSDPSSASMTCVKSGEIKVHDDASTSKEGEEFIKEDRSLFKSILVRRLYDKEGGNVVYVAYSSKLDPNADANMSRYKSSLCAVHIN